MQIKDTKIETKQVTTKSTRTTDNFKKVTQPDGEVKVMRWSQEHQVTAQLQVVDKGRGGVFHNGARIA